MAVATSLDVSRQISDPTSGRNPFRSEGLWKLIKNDFRQPAPGFLPMPPSGAGSVRANPSLAIADFKHPPAL